MARRSSNCAARTSHSAIIKKGDTLPIGEVDEGVRISPAAMTSII